MPTPGWNVPYMTVDAAVLAELYGECGRSVPKTGQGSPADAAADLWHKTFAIAR